MPAVRYDFNLEKGTYFRRTIKWLQRDGSLYNLNLGWRAHMQVRAATDGLLIVDMSTENSRIFMQDAYIRLFLDIATTNSIPVPVVYDVNAVDTSYLYDLYLYNDSQSIARRYFYGKFNVRGGITQ